MKIVNQSITINWKYCICNEKRILHCQFSLNLVHNFKQAWHFDNTSQQHSSFCWKNINENFSCIFFSQLIYLFILCVYLYLCVCVCVHVGSLVSLVKMRFILSACAHQWINKNCWDYSKSRSYQESFRHKNLCRRVAKKFDLLHCKLSKPDRLSLLNTVYLFWSSCWFLDLRDLGLHWDSSHH